MVAGERPPKRLSVFERRSPAEHTTCTEAILAQRARAADLARTKDSVQTRDVIVIGASMGGIGALSTLVAALPADLPAAVLIAQHLSEWSPGILPRILDQRGPLPAVAAEDGMPLERGKIFVAPANRHLLATGHGIRVVFGPRENRSRPSIDPLFRTAAVNYRSRVIGVVLTGLLGDGAAGLQAVARCGGVPVVQSPQDAAYDEMPRRALARVPGAHCARLDEMASLVARLSREPAPAPPPVPEALAIEAQLTERAVVNDDWREVPGQPTSFTCPECAGALQEIEDGGGEYYRCRVGHAHSADDLLIEKATTVEDTLWVALQTLEERAEMLSSMASSDRERGWTKSAASYEERARETRTHAERLRAVLRSVPT